MANRLPDFDVSKMTIKDVIMLSRIPGMDPASGALEFLSIANRYCTENLEEYTPEDAITALRHFVRLYSVNAGILSGDAPMLGMQSNLTGDEPMLSKRNA